MPLGEDRRRGGRCIHVSDTGGRSWCVARSSAPSRALDLVNRGDKGSRRIFGFLVRVPARRGSTPRHPMKNTPRLFVLCVLACAPGAASACAGDGGAQNLETLALP